MSKIEEATYIIPLIYKNFNRIRGQEVSANLFKTIINRLNDTYQYGIEPLLVEVEEIKELYKHKWFRDKILFSFNFIQDLNARGVYPLIARKHDICFSKLCPPVGYNNEYAQAELHAEMLGMKFFPKYILDERKDPLDINNSWHTIINFHKGRHKLNVGIYHRADTCPIQSNAYYDFQRMNGCYNYKLIGYGSNRSYDNQKIKDILTDIDVVLYTPPTHADPWPNFIFECLASCIPVIFLHRKYQVIGSGIQELRGLFPQLFIDVDLTSIVYPNDDKVQLELLKKYSNYEDSAIRAINNWSIKQAMLLRDTTVFRISGHIEKVINERTNKNKKENPKICNQM